MDGSNEPVPDGARVWSRLTQKQRDCLDLLLERKTSKQIARALEIAKPTVDQRITAARKTLGAADRNEAALLYARLKAMYDRNTYDPMHLPPTPKLVPSDFENGDPDDAIALNDSASGSAESSGPLPPFRGLWRHDHDLTRRMAIMAAMLVSAVIVILAGLGIAQALTRLISG
ncbi:LuxR C-terminal-related transcriptional regulator [Pelagerythrobacter aerophilus]